MVLITCDGDDCDNREFQINYAPPAEFTCICPECGSETDFGGA